MYDKLFFKRYVQNKFFQLTWKSQQLHKGINCITVDVSFGRAVKTELRQAVNPRNILNFVKFFYKQLNIRAK